MSGGKNLTIVILFLFLATLSAGYAHADTYKYTDKDGVIIFTDNLQSVPKEYAKKVIVIKDETQKPAEIPSKKEQAEKPAGSPSVPASAQEEGANCSIVNSVKAIGNCASIAKLAVAVVLLLVFIFIGRIPRLAENKKIITLIRATIILLVIAYAFQTYLNRAADMAADLKNETEALKKQAEKRELKMDQIAK